jgi:dephospho-CoA kinase
MKSIRIALTGGIATGKSTVARMFEELGAAIIDADQVARDVLKPGTECSRKLFEIIGPNYFDRNGEIKRRELREGIIEDEGLRARVNSVIHPSVMAAMEGAWRERQEDSGGQQVVIFDIPLLFEARQQERFQLVILVYTPRKIQMARLMARDGLTEEQAEKTLSMQWPIDEKRALSHLVIDNSGDQDETRQQVSRVWQQIVSKVRGASSPEQRTE